MVDLVEQLHRDYAHFATFIALTVPLLIREIQDHGGEPSEWQIE